MSQRDDDNSDRQTQQCSISTIVTTVGRLKSKLKKQQELIPGKSTLRIHLWNTDLANIYTVRLVQIRLINELLWADND